MEEMKQIPVTCSVCQKKEIINVTPQHIENAVGGLFRVAIIHQCKDTSESQVLVVFLDKKLFVRNQTLAPLSTPSKQTSTQQTSLPALTRLIDTKELSKVLFNVFTGTPVVITGDQGIVPVIVETLALFSPFNPKIILWEEEIPSIPLEGPQIIGMRTVNPKNDVFKESLILDLFASKTIGNSIIDPFCLSIASDTHSLVSGGGIFVIQSIVEELIGYVKLVKNSRKDLVPKNQLFLVEKMAQRFESWNFS